MYDVGIVPWYVLVIVSWGTRHAKHGGSFFKLYGNMKFQSGCIIDETLVKNKIRNIT